MVAVTDPIFFFTAQTANANSTVVNARFPLKDAQFSVYGTFNGATVTLEYSPDGQNTWITVKDLGGADVAATSARGYPVRAPVGEPLRAVLSGAGGSTSLTAKLEVI